MRKIWKIFFTRTFIWLVLILIQLGFMVSLVYSLRSIYPQVDFLLQTLSIFMVIYIINRNDNPGYKLAWCICILSMPLVGGLFYLLFGGKKVPKALQRGALETAKEMDKYLYPQDEVINELYAEDVRIAKQFRYIAENAYYPVYKNTSVTYFKSGEEKFAALLDELKKAKHTIYMEYFIIAEGRMWNTILDILIAKSKAGVDVRLIYDDAGCFETLPKDYEKTLRDLGIQCELFNPLRPKLVIQMNNRDHRKLVIIDNEVAFTGGINLADEYINEKDRFGHWKDTAIMMKGEAVWNCTVMFLQMWNFLSVDKVEELQLNTTAYPQEEGYVLPFSDSPTDDEAVGLNVHMNCIQNAKHSVYIQTPYLIISYEMIQALCTAAKSGIDVRITVPHIPDKWYAHMMTQGNYEELIRNGVKIYEYLPGFIHSKMFLVDDEIGLIGTINMDYRSYYLHYEDGVLLYKCKALQDMMKDYLETLELSQEITLEDCRKTKLPIQLFHAILNVLSPLM